jgi:hypothetical protein
MSEELSFVSKGSGGDLVRYKESSGVRFQFKTGHGFYRIHRMPDGSESDLRTTGLTPDRIETEIIADLLLFLDSGGELPVLGEDFRMPLQREVLIERHRLAYRIVELTDGTVSVGTYFALL